MTETLSYDALNHLVKDAVGTTGQEQYVSDAAGNRVLKRSTSGSTTSLVAYANGGLQELTSTGAGVFSSQLDYYSLAGHLIGSSNGTTTSSDLTDAEGSVLLNLTSSAIQGEQAYGPYGNQRYTQGSIGSDKGYTGQFHDALTGLDFYNARYYDPTLGQFLVPDDVQGNTQGMDPYAYAGDNPETKTDPSGQKYVDNSGDYGYISPEGDLALFNPFPTMTSGNGYNEGGNYAYHHWFYSKTVARQPVSASLAGPQNNGWAILFLAQLLADPAIALISLVSEFLPQPGCGALEAATVNLCAGGYSSGLDTTNLGDVNGFADKTYAGNHYGDHGAQMGAQTWQQYEQAARNFMSGAPGPNEYQIWNATLKEFYRWNAQTGDFGIYDPVKGRMVSYYDIGAGSAGEAKFARQYWAIGKKNGQTQYAPVDHPSLSKIPASEPVVEPIIPEEP